MNAKTCEICKKRPAAPLKTRQAEGMSADMDFCVPCFEEAGWENTHSDDGHEGFESLTVRKSVFNTKAELEAWKANVREEIKGCWICNPELNKAQREYAPRTGTSRAGMVINVPIRAAGVEKAAVVEKALTERFEVKVTTNKKTGVTALTAKSAQESFILFWDGQGRFEAGTVQENGRSRKVRNVAEVLRLAS